jgi:hypothetical protein
VFYVPIVFKKQKMKMKNGILTLLLFCALGAAAQGSVNVVFDKNTVEAGDTFVLRVMVANVSAEPSKVDFSTWKELLPEENILSQSRWVRTGGRWVRQFTLIAFDSASLQLPPLKVFLRSGEAVASNPLVITIKPTYATADVSTAEPIRDIHREPPLWADFWPYAVGAIFLFGLIYWFSKRKKPKPAPIVPTSPPTPMIPPHERALRQLAILEKQKLWKQGKLEQFYAELSLIVREYLENRFSVSALESTTREIVPMLKSKGFPENLKDTLHQILHVADMAKYAQNPPPEEFHEKALDEARRLVKATSPHS